MHKQLNFISILRNVIYHIVVGNVLIVCLAKVGGHLRINSHKNFALMLY